MTMPTFLQMPKICWFILSFELFLWFAVTLVLSLTAACQATFALSPEGSEQGEVVGKRGKRGEEQQEKEAGGEEKATEAEGKNVLKYSNGFRCCTVSVCHFFWSDVYFLPKIKPWQWQLLA